MAHKKLLKHPVVLVQNWPEVYLGIKGVNREQKGGGIKFSYDFNGEQYGADEVVSFVQKNPLYVQSKKNSPPLIEALKHLQQYGANFTVPYVGYVQQKIDDSIDSRLLLPMGKTSNEAYYVWAFTPKLVVPNEDYNLYENLLDKGFSIEGKPPKQKGMADL